MQVFDLKGSLRNRNVKTDSGKESCEVVLLDENLLKLIHDNPLYIRSHCKSILRAAIHSDAYFLSSHLIIDYSLLVGRDDATDQLVVGIIGKRSSIEFWIMYRFPSVMMNLQKKEALQGWMESVLVINHFKIGLFGAGRRRRNLSY